MDIGDFNKRIILQSQSSTYDLAGQQVESWSTFATVWANIKHNSGLETIKSDALASTVKTSIRIRYLSGVHAGMRVIYSGLQYEVTAVLPHVDEKRYIDLVCRLINGEAP